MTHAKFEKVGRSEKPLYGPRKLLLCGFPPGAQSKFLAVLGMVGLGDVSRVWVVTSQGEQTLAALLALEDDSGAGLSSDLPRAIIVAGITENELMRLMSVCKKTGMAQSMWAALTPTSENWTVSQLLTELTAERKQLQKRR
jgi:hypothetical protein